MRFRASNFAGRKWRKGTYLAALDRPRRVIASRLASRETTPARLLPSFLILALVLARPVFADLIFQSGHALVTGTLNPMPVQDMPNSVLAVTSPPL